jgi:hypothetical protein
MKILKPYYKVPKNFYFYLIPKSSVADPDDTLKSIFLPKKFREENCPKIYLGRDLDPDLDPTFENFRFRTIFFTKFFRPKYALKSTFMNQKVKQVKNPIFVFLDLTHTKIDDVGSFIKVRIRSQTSGSGSRRPDPQHCKIGLTIPRIRLANYRHIKLYTNFEN